MFYPFSPLYSLEIGLMLVTVFVAAVRGVAGATGGAALGIGRSRLGCIAIALAMSWAGGRSWVATVAVAMRRGIARRGRVTTMGDSWGGVANVRDSWCGVTAMGDSWGGVTTMGNSWGGIAAMGDSWGGLVTGAVSGWCEVLTRWSRHRCVWRRRRGWGCGGVAAVRAYRRGVAASLVGRSRVACVRCSWSQILTGWSRHGCIRWAAVGCPWRRVAVVGSRTGVAAARRSWRQVLTRWRCDGCTVAAVGSSWRKGVSRGITRSGCWISMRASGVGRRWGGIMATTGNRSRCVGRAGRRRVVAAVGIRLGWQIGLTQWAGHAQCGESQQSSANGEGTLVKNREWDSSLTGSSIATYHVEVQHGF